MQVARDFPLTISGLGETQHEHGQGLHGKAPNHTEGVESGQDVYVAEAEKDHAQLHSNDQIDDAEAGSVPVVRLLKPGGEDAVFSYPIQNSVCSNDGSVLRPGKDQDTNQNHEAVEKQLGDFGAGQVNGDSTNQVREVIRALRVGNNHDREERDQGREEETVDEDYEPGLFQILELGMLNFAVDLREGFFATHRQDRVTESHKGDERHQ